MPERKREEMATILVIEDDVKILRGLEMNLKIGRAHV